MSSPHTHTALCRPDCRYRVLYEGSQASLSDLASRQALALARVGRIRAALVEMLKRAAPEKLAAAEASLGRRLSALDDEVLLAHVEQLLAPDPLTRALQATQASQAAEAAADGSRHEDALQSLRQAMVAAGYPIPEGADLHVLAQAVAAGIPRVQLPVAVTAMGGSLGWQGPAVPDVVPAQDAPLSDVFDDPYEDLPPPPEPEYYEEETAHAPVVTVQVAGSDEVAVAGEDFADPFADPQVGGPVDDFDDPFADFEPDTAGSAVTDLAALFLDADVAPDSASESATDSEAAVGSPVPAPERVARSHRPSRAVADGAAGDSADAPGQVAVDAEVAPVTEAEEPASPARGRGSRGKGKGADRANEEQETLPVGTGLAVSDPVKPQLFPAGPASRASRKSRPSPVRPRVIRTAVEQPDPSAFDVPPEREGEPVELSEEVQKAILSAVALPQPVFASDLVGIAGGPDQVAAWESAMMADLAHAPVRFVPAKRRHLARGSLVMPKQLLREHALEFQRSWWSRCLELHRGAKLYELGVLLHRVGEQVVSHDVPDDRMTITLRLAAPRGMVGVVVAIDDRLGEGDPGRAAVGAAVDRLLSDRLTLLAVLSTFDDIEPLIGALESEARQRNWQPACPVVVSRSWQFASDSGASATLVLGG